MHGLDVLLDNNDEYTPGIEDNGTEERSDHSEPEAETPTPMSKPRTSMLTNPMIPVCSYALWWIEMSLTFPIAYQATVESASSLPGTN